MTLSMTRAFGFIALAASLGAGVSQAAQATFHLDVPAHWGTALLQPGDYHVRVDDSPTGAKEVMVKGRGLAIFALPAAVDARITNGASIKLVKVKGEYFVREFRSDVARKSYTFAVPGGVEKLHPNSVLVSK